MIDKIKSRLRTHKWLSILAGAVLVGFVGVQATVAFLAADTAPIVNVFKPVQYKQGAVTLMKHLDYPVSLQVDPKELEKLQFDFMLEFKAKTPTSSAYSMVSQSGTGSALRLGSTGSSYMLRASTPSAYAFYNFGITRDGQTGTITADEDGRITLQLSPGEQVEISGIDEGTTVTITEEDNWSQFYAKDGYTQQLVVDDNDPQYMGHVQFVNVYQQVGSHTTTDYEVYIDKTLTGRAMQAGDSFEFCLEYLDMATGDWVPFAKTYVVNSLNANGPDGAFGDAGDYAEYGGLGGFEFDEPGIYSFRVSEVIPADDKKLKDVTYDTAKGVFTVTVGDKNIDGKLDILKVDADTDSLDKVTVDHDDERVIVSFTNTYKKSGGGGGGGGITPSKPKDPNVPEILKSGDHYAYVFGYPDGTVQPEGQITRAEVAAIFCRLIEDDVKAPYVNDRAPFADVAEDAWYAPDIAIMYGLGIAGGYPDGTFRPDAPITRAEFTAMASKLDDLTVLSTRVFPDIAGHWAEEAILLCVEAGWIGGYEDGTMRPDRYITRVEAMSIVNHVLNRQPETIDDLHDDMIHWPDNADTTKWYYITVQEATNGHAYALKENGYEYWTEMDNAEEKQSFLDRILKLLGR